jgi:hypothetical protein
MKRKYYQGRFKPRNPSKYIGNAKNIMYRSGWELQYMRILDNNPNVKRWASEEISIQYFNPAKNRKARYFPDFFVETVDENKQQKKYLMEIKPMNEITPPKLTDKKKVSRFITESMTWSVNQAKWKAAKAWCEQYNINFVVVTRDAHDKFVFLTEDKLGLV